MAWHRLSNPVNVDHDFNRKCPLLVDESLGPETARYLKTRACNVKFADDVGLRGRSDEEILGYAWREGRMLWTHDRDFLDDGRFPEHRNPGIVVLPGGAGDDQAMAVGLITALRIFGFGPTAWRKTKAIVSPTGEVKIRLRDFETGRIEARRYRLSRGWAEEWRG
jgi:predicted nuclease of predicted toxin-antitoxin system